MNSDATTDNAISAVVGIGCSAGGLAALQGLLQALPQRTGLCLIVVNHLDPDHDSELASILQRETALTVQQVLGTVELAPEHVYVVAPAHELRVSDGVLKATDQSGKRGNPIDALFCSLAEAYGTRALAILLSGGTGDGMAGTRAVKEAQGLVLVQSPDEAEFPELVRQAISLELADVTAPVAELAARVVEIAEHGAFMAATADGLDERQTGKLRKILSHLRARVGHDFSAYKRSTVLRRLQRRMNLTQSRDMNAYLTLLRSSNGEAEALYSDLLISVTNFFRDPDSFDALEKQVIPKLLEGREAEDRVRVWSVGCATGEEAYSVSMLLLEHAAKLKVAPKLQVFASDIDQRALIAAREGLYPSTIEADVSAERLRRFFVREGEHYRVTRELRDTVLFAKHSVLGDPPFTRLDLITCRNLLIYLQRPLQDKVLDIFHYALGQNGYLFLGSAESGEGASQQFRAIDKQRRLYQARARSHEHAAALPSLPMASSEPPEPELAENQRATRPASHEAGLHWRMLEDYGPPSVIVDDSYRVVHLSERAGRYLRPPGGTPTHDLLRLTRAELQLELRRALFEAFDKGKATVCRGMPVELDGVSRMVYVSVRPRQGGEASETLALITFDEGETERSRGTPSKPDAGHVDGDGVQLEHELTRTRERLQDTFEQHESAQEELNAQNEELRSINEEYKSTMEELETSKEELHSVNEELQSVNAELEANLEEVKRTHSDLQNLVAATEVGTLFLDRDLRVQRYTDSVGSIFNLIASDIGRPIADLSPRLDYDQLEADARRVLRDLTVLERELHAADDSWLLMRLRPYRTVDDKIEGVVMTLVNITAQRRAMEGEQRAKAFAQQVIDTVREGLVVLDPDLRVESANQSFYRMFGLIPRNTEGELIYRVGDGEWDIPELRRLLGEILPAEHNFIDFEVRHAFRSIGERVMLLNGLKLDHHGKILLAIVDVTDQRNSATLLTQHTEALELADSHKDDFLAILGHELRNPLAALSSSVALVDRGLREEQRGRAMEVVKNQIGTLTSLLDDLLDLARVSHGKVELNMERTDLVQVATEVIEGLEARTSSGIELKAPAELVLYGDPRRLGQVLQNLLSNALKHTPDAGRIVLEIGQRNARAEVAVTDTGAGIDSADLERIFERFTQMRPASGGLGIGLALVREIVALHGGEVAADSDGLGTGTTFKLSIPLQHERIRSDPPAQEAAPAAVLDGARILIVDDNKDAATSLALLLEHEGAKVDLAYDGSSVVAMARDGSPALIFLDIGLPDIDGAEVARRLRADPVLSEVPIIALTGFAASRYGEDRDLFDAWLTKPVNVDDLARVAARLLVTSD